MHWFLASSGHQQPKIRLWELECGISNAVWYKYANPYLLLPKLFTLRWRHNELDGVSDHQPHDCLLNGLFGRRSKKISKLRVTDLCAGNSPGPVNSPHKKASHAENVSIWWRHHGPYKVSILTCLREHLHIVPSTYMSPKASSHFLATALCIACATEYTAVTARVRKYFLL